MSSKYIELAAIAGAHGIKGDVLLRLFGDDKESLTAYGPLTDEQGTNSFTIKNLRSGRKNLLIARIDEITDRNLAEQMKGTKLYIERAKLPPPEEDEFYYADLIGLEARLEDGSLYGKILQCHDFGAGDLLELMPQNSQTSMYLSFTSETVPDVNISGGYITIILPATIEAKEEDTPPAEG
ncbi:MAG: ribosome maturation factor RimM [Rhodomicrobium sp.]|nr:MAG: ribosome maturation factor RimM [Rhodomicrobium sp.]